MAKKNRISIMRKPCVWISFNTLPRWNGTLSDTIQRNLFSFWRNHRLPEVKQRLQRCPVLFTVWNNDWPGSQNHRERWPRSRDVTHDHVHVQRNHCCGWTKAHLKDRLKNWLVFQCSMIADQKKKWTSPIQERFCFVLSFGSGAHSMANTIFRRKCT